MYFRHQGIPKRFRARSNGRELWLSEFGEHFAVANQILELLCLSYVIDTRDRFAFLPDDSIETIDESFFPKGNDDFLELVCFFDYLRQYFKLEFSSWNDLQLRDIVNSALLQQSNDESQPGSG